MHSEEASRIRARARWRVLAKAVARSNDDGDERGSPLGLFTFNECAGPESDQDENIQWFDVDIGNASLKTLTVNLITCRN
jgi:hypothetical protein